MIHIFDGKHKGKCPVEDVEQMASMLWFDYQYPQYQTLCFHVMNESVMPVQGRVKAKKKGVKSGVSDILLLLKRGKYSGLIVELKRKSKNKSTPVSDTQDNFLHETSEQGFYCAVCYGFEQFEICVKQYLNIR